MKNKSIFLKLYFLTFIMLTSNQLFSQEILQPTNEKSYTEYMDKVLGNLISNDSQNFKNGILYDRVYPISKLNFFNDPNIINSSNSNHFNQVWNELYKASISPDFLTLKQVKSISYHYEREQTIQIGIINVDFSMIDSLSLKPNNQKLQILNEKVNRIANINPYITKHSLVISPLNSNNIKGNSVEFEFGKIFLDKSDKKIKSLTASFDKFQSFNIINNEVLINSKINVSFQKSGKKDIEFNVVFSDNSTITTYASFYINTNIVSNKNGVSNLRYIQSTKPFQGYDEPSDCNGSCLGSGEYKIYFSGNNTEIVKPFIIVDGFDPEDKRKIDAAESINSGDDNLYNMMNYGTNKNLVVDLNTEGHDVIIISFPKYLIGQETIFIPTGGIGWITINIYRDGGADYVERNAKVLEALISEINTTLLTNGSSEKIKIAGPSMGALVVQYALSEMEQDNENHNTDLFVSFDGPHKGANINIGMQKAISYFDIQEGKSALETKAAKQMLINHYLSYSEGLPQGAPNFRNYFQTELDNIGFPQQCRNVAVINGSVIGTEKATAGGNFAYADLTAIFGFLRRTVWINYTDNSGQKVVFRYLKKNWWGSNTQSDTRKRSTTSVKYGSLDNSPGGFLNIKSRIEDELGGSFPYYLSSWSGITTTNINAFYDLNFGKQLLVSLLVNSFYVNLTDDFSFVPTKSALAFKGSNSLWREEIGCRNLVCTGETPFDSYYSPLVNQEHADLTNEGISWLLQEVDGIDQLPSVYENCSNSNLTINNNVSLNQTDIQASNSILTATNTIHNGAIVKYSATNTVYLKPNFHAKLGSSFIASVCPGGELGRNTNINNDEIYFKDNETYSLNDENLKVEELTNELAIIKIYPNPTKDNLFLESNVDIISWVLTDVYGKSYYNGTTSSKINMTHLPTGLYFIKVVLITGDVKMKSIIKK